MFTTLLALALLAPAPTSATPHVGEPTPGRQALTPSNQGGSISDQAAFEATIAAISRSQSIPSNGTLGYAVFQNGAVIEPGVYDAGGFTLPAGSYPSAVRLVARIPGTVIIRIPAEQYFLTVAGHVNAVQVDGITFVGGKGAFRFTHTGNNVNLLQSFTRNVFLNYTECAISNEANDHPYLRVRDNVFLGAKDAHTVGVAWGGYLDQGVIEDNAFLQNAYHVKLGPYLSSTMLVRHNDFINWGGPVNRTQADVWILPNITDHYGVNSGFGITITENKFGNENQSPDAPRILIANEDPASGPDRATRRPAGDDHGIVSQLVITGNLFSGGGNLTSPIMRSAISELRNMEWRSNKMGGSPHTAILQWTNPRPASFTNGNSSFEFTPADGVAGGLLARSFSNAVFAQMRDYGGFFPGDPNAIDLWPVSDSPELAVLANGIPASARQPLGTVTVRPVEGSRRNLSLVTLHKLGTQQGLGMSFGDASLAQGGMIFLDIALQKAPQHGLLSAVVEIRNAVDAARAYYRIVPLPDALGTLRTPVYLPPSRAPEAWQLRVFGGGPYGDGPMNNPQDNSFITGDWIINTGNARIGRNAVLQNSPH